MPLLFDSDYEILHKAGVDFEEEDGARFLLFKNFPLPKDVYLVDEKPADAVHVLYVIPQNYNSSGGDMFWVHPRLHRSDGKPIPNTGGPRSNEDSRTHNGLVFCRWSRHWHNNLWKPKVDNIRTIMDRISWAFKYPDARRS
ncbi:E2/UBC family protein [Mesorhizobium sp. WSM3224]|uniref:E2/UBC family protein n=1 Tax=Mesorhizobium sp. WSM3224 TaxID=1040986 RepID=UPI000486DB21|nr:E2/UBC family protein [Mesorhizobium sp. WSM3224]